MVVFGALHTGGCCAAQSARTTTAARLAAATVPSTAPALLGLTGLRLESELDALARPPIGWEVEGIKTGARFVRQTWISPTGETAYGIIRFNLPLPVGHELVLRVFLSEMKKSEGRGELVSETWDDALKGLRFVAAGGRYTVRTNLFVHGFSGWAVFAGTRSDAPVDARELNLAEKAREATVVDVGE